MTKKNFEMGHTYTNISNMDGYTNFGPGVDSQQNEL